MLNAHENGDTIRLEHRGGAPTLLHRSPFELRELPRERSCTFRATLYSPAEDDTPRKVARLQATPFATAWRSDNRRPSSPTGRPGSQPAKTTLTDTSRTSAGDLALQY